MKREEILELPQLVQQYLNYLDVVKNQSTLTINEYASDIRTFLRFIMIFKGEVKANVPMNKIDLTQIDLEFFKNVSLNDCYQFLSYCKNERKNNEKTRARKIISVRRFYTYLTENLKLLSENPIKAIESPKQKKAAPKYLTLEESLMLLNSINGPYKQRDYAIITIFLNCGLRLSELVNINFSDINSDNVLTVTGKGNKERKVFLNDACMSAINSYIKVRAHDGVKTNDKDALFLSSRNQRISQKTVQFLVKDYLNKAGLGGRGLSCHKLRHTAATLMYQHGNVDVLVLKDILGHENLSTTEIYTHLSSEQSKNALKSNPLSKIKPD